MNGVMKVDEINNKYLKTEKFEKLTEIFRKQSSAATEMKT